MIASFGFGGMQDEVPDVLAVGSWVCPCKRTRILDSHQPIMWAHCHHCDTSAEITGGPTA